MMNNSLFISNTPENNLINYNNTNISTDMLIITNLIYVVLFVI